MGAVQQWTKHTSLCSTKDPIPIRTERSAPLPHTLGIASPSSAQGPSYFAVLSGGTSMNHGCNTQQLLSSSANQAFINPALYIRPTRTGFTHAEINTTHRTHAHQPVVHKTRQIVDSTPSCFAELADTKITPSYAFSCPFGPCHPLPPSHHRHPQIRPAASYPCLGHRQPRRPRLLPHGPHSWRDLSF